MNPTPQESYEWLKGQLYAKQDWLERFGSGKNARPEFEIEQKRRDEMFLLYFCGAYEAKLERESAA